MFPLLKKFASSVVLSPSLRKNVFVNSSKFHTSVPLYEDDDEDTKGPRSFLTYNDKIYPPQTENEEPRPAVSEIIF